MARPQDPIKGYLRDTISGETLEFQYNPQPLRDNESLGLTTLSVPSASHPRIIPSAPGPREISFTIQFSRDSDDKSEVAKKASWLKSLRYPSEGSRFETYRAPVVLFVFGKFYKIPCYLKQVNMNFDQMFDPATLEPWFVSAAVVFVEASEEDLTTVNIRRRGAFNAVR